MKTLIFWGGGSAAAARGRHGPDVTFVLWSDEHAAELRRAGVTWRAASSYLEPAGAEHVEEAAGAWTKAWGRRPLLDGKSFRELALWKGQSLWWWAELYLHHSTEATRYVRVIELLTRILEAEAPDEAEIVGLPRDEALLAARTCTAWRVLLQGRLPRGPAGIRRRLARVWLLGRLNTLKTVLTALKATLGGAAPRLSPSRLDDLRRTVLFLSHAAFWRLRRDPATGATQVYEHYFDRIIPEVEADPHLRAAVVAVGPRAPFRRRGLRDRLGEWLRLRGGSRRYVHVNRYTRLRVVRETWRATAQMRAAWRSLRDAPALRESLSHSGVSFADLAAPDVAATLLLQLPWAARSYEETVQMLRAVRPDVLCLYAESSGWGRAALAACRAEGVRTVAIQHGILYPTYFSYLHEADEAACPRPDLTALFGEAARNFLVTRGHYAPETLAVTGSPKFDDLLKAAAAWDRAALRARLGLGEDEKLVVLASRFRPIRSTHQAVGSAFPGLVAAVEQLEHVRCVVKPHPAERADAYEAVLRSSGATRVRVVGPSSDLMELLFAADVLVTVESLSAVEALVLDRPVLVLNMPTNLRELVEAGVAYGVPEGVDPKPALWALLFDPPTAERLAQARAEYRPVLAAGNDGKATQRIVGLLREAAGASGAGANNLRARVSVPMESASSQEAHADERDRRRTTG